MSCLRTLLLWVIGTAAYQVPSRAIFHCQCSGGQIIPATIPCAALPEQRVRSVLMQITGEETVIKSDETYRIMLRSLIETNTSLAAQVNANYNLFDYGFLQKLEAAIASEKSAATKDGLLSRLVEIQDTVNAEMAERMKTAAQTMREILSSPSAVVMEGKMAGLARQGKVDDALLQLLEANLQQAEAAGEQGKGAVGVLTKLKDRVRNELDKTLSPASALLRQLLRTDSSDERTRLLKEKMAPKVVSSVVLASIDGGTQEPESSEPDVPPKVMAEAIKELKLRFGNVDEMYDTGFVKKLETIADEAEAVALELAGGKEMTSKDQQDMMWNQQMVSVWDLEAVEEEAHQNNQLAVWEEEAQAQMARQDTDAREAAVKRDMGLQQ